jgi:hypothetical protein
MVSLAACASDVDTDDTTPAAEVPVASAPADPSPAAPATAPNTGTAHVTLTAEGVALDGEYPAVLCGGPYIMGEGVSYQTRADGWQITLASEARTAGTFALRDDATNYGLIVNGPGIQYLARAGGGQVLTVSGDFRTAEVTDAEVRHVVGTQTARVSVRFDCE